MAAHEQLRHLLTDEQDSHDALIVGELLGSLSEGKDFSVHRLLELSYPNMLRTLELIEEWHLQRHRYRHIQDYLNEVSGPAASARGN